MDHNQYGSQSIYFQIEMTSLPQSLSTRGIHVVQYIRMVGRTRILFFETSLLQIQQEVAKSLDLYEPLLHYEWK